MSVEVSVVVPFYNEEGCVLEFIERAMKSLEGIQYELVLVNDGSTDKTGDILKDFSLKHREIRYISLSRNRGQSIAIYCGFQHTLGDFVIMMDGDLQNRPEDILLLINEAKKGFDLVSGLRSSRQDSFFRKFLSKTANWFIRLVTGCNIRDMGGFKCLKGNVARSIYFRNGYHRFLPVLVYMMGGSTVEIEVTHEKRSSGKSKYGAFSRMIDVVFDIIMLWFLNASKSRPLYLLGKLSLIQIIFATLIFSYLIYSKFIGGESIGNRPLFFVDLLLFGTGMLTMCVAILSDFIIDIYNGTYQQKPYLIRYDSYKK